ncbi:MAG: hypothetical protein R3F29_06410 [Planctomycetota bacterium]
MSSRPAPSTGTATRTNSSRTPADATSREHTSRGHYRPTQPSTTTPRTTTTRTTTARPTTGTRVTTSPRATTSPRPTSSGRARPTTRYTPRDTARTPTLSTKPALTLGSTAAAPRLVPRATTPRLSYPRAPRYGSYSSFYPRTYSSFGSFGSFGNYACGTRFWNSWYSGSWCYRPWRNSFWWNYSTCSLPGFNPFWWNVGVLAPYYAWNYSYWNSCYSSSWYYGWSRPYGTSWSYWWYPSGTYCPTYLYVPSSVAVVPTADLALVADPAPEADAAPAAPAAPSIVDTARAPIADVVDSSPEALAARYVELGDFYFRADRFEDAAEAYAKARSYAPDDASVHFVLADAVFANKDYHYAAFLIAEAVRLEPGIVTAKTDKREFYADPALFEAQLDELQRYVADKPYDAWAELVLGYNLRFSDRTTRAVAAFRRVLELDPGNPTATAFLADLTPAPLPTPETTDGSATGKKDR